MDELENFISMLRPAEEDRAILMYGSQYRLWLVGKYVGTAMWLHDDHLGDCFQNNIVVNGQLLQFVYIADKYELVINTRKQKATN